MINVSRILPNGLVGLIDQRQIGAFYNDLKNQFAHYVGASQILGMWAGADGDGLYTRAASKAGVILIKNVIDGVKKIPGTNWRRPSPEHEATFSYVGSYGKPWKYRGNVYKNIIARKRGKGYEVGIKATASAPQIGFRTMAQGGAKGKKIPVKRYAAWVEYGTKYMEPQPLFGPAAQYYASTVGPMLHLVVSRSVNRVANDFKIQKSTGAHATGSASAVTSSFTMASANPDQDFSTKAFEMSAKLPSSGYQVSKYGGKSGLQQVKKSEKKSLKELESGLKRTIGSHAELDDAAKWLAENPEFLSMPED